MKKIKYKIGSQRGLTKLLAILILLFMIAQIFAIFQNVPGTHSLDFQIGPFNGMILLHEILLILGGYLLLFLVDAAYLCHRGRRERIA